MNLRDKIRSLTVASKKHFKSELFSYADGGEEIKVEFRELTRKRLSQLMKKATTRETNNEGKEIDRVDNDKFMYYAIIEMTFIPETDEQVFEEGDIESFEMQPASNDNFITLFSKQINKMIGEDTAEQAEKNSKETANSVSQ
jgi:hypothetical protein